MKYQVLQPPSERKSNEIRAKYNWPKIGEPGSQPFSTDPEVPDSIKKEFTARELDVIDCAHIAIG
eukprot:4426316-Pyramimonas_sp.AAC.1